MSNNNYDNKYIQNNSIYHYKIIGSKIWFDTFCYKKISHVYDSYIAFDTKLQREVEIIIFYSYYLLSPEFIYLKEKIIQVSKFTHFNLRNVYSFFEYKDTYILILENITAVRLRELTIRHKGLDEKHAIKIILQLLYLFKFLEINGVKYYSLTCEDVFVDFNFNIKINYFSDNYNSLARISRIREILYYSSPEQIRRPEDIDVRSNIYNLGIIFYYILTQKSPYNDENKSDFEMMNDIVYGEINSPCNYNSRISVDIEKIVMKMLEKDVDKRFQNYQECRDGLKSISNINKEVNYSHSSIINSMNIIIPEIVQFKYKKRIDDKLIEQSLEIGKYQVTQREWESVMGHNPSKFKGSNSPVENVSYIQVKTYLNILSILTNYNFRLPTDEEWSIAALLPLESDDYYPCSSETYSWFAENSDNKTHAVGCWVENKNGLNDIFGNVWEWCDTDYYFLENVEENNTALNKKLYKSIRGGCFLNSKEECIKNNKSGAYIFHGYDTIGFRVVRESKVG